MTVCAPCAVDLILGHDRDRLRCLEDRRIGLGCGDALLRGVAGYRPRAAFHLHDRLRGNRSRRGSRGRAARRPRLRTPYDDPRKRRFALRARVTRRFGFFLLLCAGLCSSPRTAETTHSAAAISRRALPCNMVHSVPQPHCSWARRREHGKFVSDIVLDTSFL